MSKLNICIIIICLLLFIIIYLLCNNKCIYKPIKKLYGGEENNNIENINQEIKQEQEKIDTISNELESMRRNLKKNKEEEGNTFGETRERPKEDDIELNQQENNTFIMRLMDEEINNKKINNNNRQILDGVENTGMIQENENIEEDIEDEEVIEEEETKKIKGTRAWENMCEGDEVKTKKKKTQFDDLKLNLNNSNYLEPFNNDDFSEFGKFNC